MKYTWPKFKLCRREQANIFWPDKYDIRKRRTLPGQPAKSGGLSRLSEYGKLLRNKQLLKRMYLLTEKQFAKIVTQTAQKHAKNNDVDHDKALLQFLESRVDAIVLRAGFANTIMQARQMVTHGHLLLNGHKHNIPSAYLKAGDVITVKDKLKTSALYSSIAAKKNMPSVSWLKVDVHNLSIEVLREPSIEELTVPVDLLKVVEFYARV